MTPAFILPYAFALRAGIIARQDMTGRTKLYSRPDVSISALIESQRLCGGPVACQRISEAEYENLLSETYRSSASRAADIAAGAATDLVALAENAAEVEDLLDAREDAPVVQLINALLIEAVREKASDVHVEVHEHRLVIRFRIDGVLQDRLEPKRSLGPMLVSRIKVMAGLDIAEKRKPHDGRVTLTLGGHEIDVRVSTIPSQYGERVVLRLLDRTTARFDLTRLGMSERDLGVTRRLLEKPGGMILVTGPTGSGKTTTLYSAISYLNSRERNIMTIEDPVEYAFDGIGQMQVNAQKQLTFAEGVRVLMRQDPDVILIGEIRDPETAAAAIRATTSGHLVLATLHTTSAVASITRLTDMGVNRYLLSTLVSGLIAQRLVRCLCETCKKPGSVSAEEAARLNGRLRAGEPTFRATGCKDCNFMGYRGRTAIYEVVLCDPGMATLIYEGAAQPALAGWARRAGPGLLDDGLARVRSGVTTIEEVVAAAEIEEPYTDG
jgi:general secretion pathway protein E